MTSKQKAAAGLGAVAVAAVAAFGLSGVVGGEPGAGPAPPAPAAAQIPQLIQSDAEQAKAERAAAAKDWRGTAKAGNGWVNPDAARVMQERKEAAQQNAALRKN